VVGLPDEVTVISLARRHRLTVYDAAYLELTLREALPLATLHKALASAARAEGVSLIGTFSDSPPDLPGFGLLDQVSSRGYFR
jgi:hypothetical protein